MDTKHQQSHTQTSSKKHHGKTLIVPFSKFHHSKDIKSNSQKKTKSLFDIFSLSFGFEQEKEYLIENLSMLLSSGMTILSALESLKKEVRSRRMKNIIHQIEEDIDAGSSLYTSFENAQIFPTYALSLIKIGETTGHLSENLKVIALQQQKQKEFRSKLLSAALYPAFVFTLTIVIGIAIAWFILPRLALVFSQLKISLPLITRVLLKFGSILGSHGVIIVPLIVIFLLLVTYFLFIHKSTKFVGQAILFHIPIFKRLIQEVELARLGYILGTLLDSGLPVVESLQSLSNVTDFYLYRKLYLHLEESVTDGNSFQKSFMSYKNIHTLVPGPVQQLISSAELSGSLPKTLTTIGERYEAKTDITTKNLTVLLEPILLVIVWIGVVTVSLAVILPLYSLIGNLNEGG